MSFITIIFLALSVSADAFAVAIGAGISHKNTQTKQALNMALSFGFFQAFMPIIGFMLVSTFPESIMNYDHWIAFLLLGYIGGNMIYEGYSESEEKIEKDIFTIRSLLTLGVATSIDALAVGASLTASTDNIYLPAFMIGCTTFLVSFVGVKFGAKFSHHIGSRSEIIGGIILIGIGINILIDHIFG